MPIRPGQPMLVPQMRPWLTDRVTIQTPNGPDWVDVATGVAARLLEGVTRIDPGTLQPIQQTVLYVAHGAPVSPSYRVKRPSDTHWWQMDVPRDYAEAPTVEVPLKAAR